MTIAAQQGSPQFPQAVSAVAASDQTTMDDAIAELQAQKDAWVATSVPERIALIDRLISDVAAIAPRWVDACLRAKEIAPGAPGVGEEWSTGPYLMLKQLRQFRTRARRYSHARRSPHSRPRQDTARWAGHRAGLPADDL